jgi:hypothetical protein
VKNYDSVHEPINKYSYYNLKESYDYDGERKCLLKKVNNIFNSSDLINIVSELDNIKPVQQFKDPLHRSIYLSDWFYMEKIKFNNGIILDESLSQFQHYQNSTPLIQKAIRIAIERFGVEMGYKNEEIKVKWNAIKYNLSSEQSELNPLQWHTDTVVDGDYTYADYTMVVLMSDPLDPQHGWSGGNFLYSGRREIERFNGLINLKRQTNNHITNHPAFPTWEISPSVNDAILFGNFGMNHTVTPIRPNNHLGQRIIFSLFVKMV